MRTRSKLLLAALTATAFMSLLVGTASARRFQLSNQRWQAIWPLLSFETGAATVSCPVTLEGSFPSAILSKVSGQLIGYVTSAKVNGVRSACNETGSATVLNATLPWHIRYDRFIGALPSITEIRIQLIGARFQVNAGGVVCLAGTTAAAPGFGYVVRDVATGRANTLRADPSGRIPLGGEFLCGFAGQSNFRGTAEVFLQGSTSTRIVVTLVQ
jgi:hypothetical protein